MIYRAIIFPIVLNGCEAWSLILKEEHRLRVFDNRVLRRIFESKSEKVIVEWRRLQNEEFYDLYSMLITIQVVPQSHVIRRSLSTRYGMSPGCRWTNGLQYGG
jgi:hypothetical protein